MVDVFEAMLRGALDSLNRGERKRVTETARMDNVLDRLDTTSRNTLLHPAFVSWRTCASTLWPSVDTRA
jgi:hypothetical protein